MSAPTDRRKETMTELAQAAYNAYGDSAKWKNYQGNKMPEWDALPRTIQQHWIAAVIAIYDRM